MRDLIRLIIIVLFLPLIVIFIGPLLILAAVRGQQWMGPITLNSARYGAAGRAGMFLLGAVIWAMVWSGLGWLGLKAVTPTPIQVVLPTATTTVETIANVEAADSSTPTLSATTATPTTMIEPPESPTNAPTLIATKALSRAMATAISTRTATATKIFNEALSTNTPTPELLSAEITATTVTAAATGTSGVSAGGTAIPTPDARATVSVADRRAAIFAVNDANDLLREAIIQASEKNIEEMGEVWQGDAFTAIENFATKINQRYGQTLLVDYQYVMQPEIGEASTPGQIIIVTREQWRYGEPGDQKQELFEFNYTLTPNDDRWVITRYSYRNLARLSTPAATATLPPTTTPTPTHENQ